MRIQHNIMAMSAYRNYTNNVSAMQKNLEKLSSGYKINRAGDDAAGLAISEKMRAQITGLETAQKNAKDGISLVQTAEGALTEVHDMLNRMVELATQSANGTYEDSTDRAQLQKEVDQLVSEINRIADSANFNGIQLLDGSMAASAATAASTTTTTESFTGMDRIITSVLGKDEVASTMAGEKTILDGVPAGTPTKAAFAINFNSLDFTVNATATVSSTDFTVTIGGEDISVTVATIATNATAADIAKAIASTIASTYATSGSAIEINGVKWTAAVKADGIVEFTQVNVPKTAQEATANFDVNITIGDGTSTGGVALKPPAYDTTTGSDDPDDVVMSASVNAGTYVTTAGIAQETANKANTVFKITESDITDGTQIAIGSQTVILKVGGDSQVTSANAPTGAVIATIDANDDLDTALGKICAALGSTGKLKLPNGVEATFSIGVTRGDDGHAIGIGVQRMDSAAKASQAFDTLEKLANNFAINVVRTTKTEAKEATTGLTLQIGDTADSFNQLNVSIQDCHADAIGIGNIDISTQEGAADAISKIKDAINYVSDVRGTLGATQNRLDHTINNLSVMTENIQDAESTIRDVDVAEEMMAYTKNNILIQSAQAMLAQANQVPQGVLQLLQ